MNNDARSLVAATQLALLLTSSNVSYSKGLALPIAVDQDQQHAALALQGEKGDPLFSHHRCNTITTNGKVLAAAQLPPQLGNISATSQDAALDSSS
jgi:hypothetical protein